MAVTYDDAIKVLRLTATRDHVADGTLEIGTSAMGTVLATFGLSGTGGSVADAGATVEWTLAFDASPVTATGAGTAAAARIKRSAANSSTIVITGLTVGTSGSDINLDNTSIAVGQQVGLTSAKITHA